MSLVSEALRKARQEAGLRDAAGRGIPIEVVTRHVGTGRGPGVGVAAFAVVAAGLGGAVLTWWLLADRGAAVVGTVAATSPSALAQSVAVLQPAAPAGSRRTANAASSPVLSQAETTPPSTPAAVSADPASSSSRLVEAAARSHPPANEALLPGRSADLVAGAPPATSAASLARRASPTYPARPATGIATPPRTDGPTSIGRDAKNPAGERSFKIDARLGGVTLHLDYIVHRANSPFAGINGEQVLTGSVIQGFTVEEITPDAVRLSGPGGVVVLRTR